MTQIRQSLAMEPFTPFAGPYTNGPPSWHHGGHSYRSIHDDSGYASEDSDSDSDSVPSIPLDPDHRHGDTHHVVHGSQWTRRHGAAAFVNAQWSHPAASRACRSFHGSVNDSFRNYELPPPLAFEQQRGNYEYGFRMTHTRSCVHENNGRGPGHAVSQWHLDESTSPLDLAEHRARVPDALPSLNDRVESETDHALPSTSSVRHDSTSPQTMLNAPQFRHSTTSLHTGQRAENMIRSSTLHSRQPQSSSHDAQLAAARQELYQERTELEKDRRALKKKGNSLLQRKEGSHPSRWDESEDVAEDEPSGNHGPDSGTEDNEVVV